MAVSQRRGRKELNRREGKKIALKERGKWRRGKSNGKAKLKSPSDQGGKGAGGGEACSKRGNETRGKKK